MSENAVLKMEPMEPMVKLIIAKRCRMTGSNKLTIIEDFWVSKMFDIEKCSLKITITFQNFEGFATSQIFEGFASLKYDICK